MKLKYLNNILDYLLTEGSQLLEHANPLRKQRERVWNLSEEIYEHLAKIIMFGKKHKSTIHHWCSEIAANLRKCMRNTIKFGRKVRYPNEQELYKWLTENLYLEDMKGLKSLLENDYVIPNISDAELYHRILLCYKVLASYASKHEFNVNKYEEELSKQVW